MSKPLGQDCNVYNLFLNALLEIFFRPLQVCYFVAPSLRENWSVIYCCCWSLPAQFHTSLFFFLLEIFFRQLRVCYFVAPSLTRGLVCNLLLLVLASAVSHESESRRTQDRILLSQFLLTPPGTGWPRYTPGHWVPFPSPLTTHRVMVEVF
jgi:hypothetical protein